MKLKALFKSIAAVALSSALLIGSSFAANHQANAEQMSGKIVIAGSTALLPLTQQAAKEFKKLNPKVKIVVSGTSSIAGPQSVSKGVATIGACDWDATRSVGGFKAYSDLKAYKIAKIPFAVIVNKDNPVNNLSIKQIQDIYAGKITNWKQVGGKDEEIVVVNRVKGSGTRVNFEDKILNGVDIKTSGDNYIEVGKSGDMVNKVKSNPNAIGFADLAYVKGDIKAVSINGVQASTANAASGKYVFYGYGYLLTKGEAKGVDKAFIDYMLSKKFQNGSLKKLKFIPVK
ncbi:phosphate ABC transporter substrate-binding protein [Anoxybacillus sp. J5B_2022]|uniref:phosphate ABC transporter substrate-binding protein n=1 Tax=Anoxybacillus sp. J5B_2022 TaxID=3003246 RepID=UPI002285AC03|nr:phosphate ABC transporter substrate-binding protein [Anoxybacillus sp. J5B_2022]MCZ0756366.1 phosphate ABC transporter substrate-binding protein [Anoxybacillus sp. J5B_2022]